MSTPTPSDGDPHNRRTQPEPLGPDETDALGHGLVVQRYLVIEELGRGGMGRVMRAYDPKLEREVALKVLRADTFDPAGRTRLLREARIMARLNHPNVVAVYDVDLDPAHGVIIAMELVQGTTLERWLTEHTPSPRRVLETFCDAGRGLAAAHRAGLLHRDFKPSNVLVASDGRARVTDFGLAKPHNEPTPGLVSGRWPLRAAATPRSESLTGPGVVMGTPRYMAPEQHDGRRLTPAVDQYAFCVALWEALCGEYPFEPRHLRMAKDAGPPRWPSVPGVPGTVGEALARGMAVRREDRWPDMESLLTALAGGPAGRRRGWALAGVAAAVGLGVAWSVASGGAGDSTTDQASRCRAQGDAIDEVWNDEIEAAVREGLVATEAIYAADTARTVAARLDRHAHQWRAARTESCLDAEVRGVWEPATLVRAEWCLDARRLELAALVEALVHADDAVVQHAVQAAADLTPIASCRNTTMLDEEPELPLREDQARIAEIRAALFRARTLLAAGKYAAGLELLGPVIEQAEQLGWPVLLAHARATEANLQRKAGAYVEAEQAGQAAYMQAVHSGAWHLASTVASNLAFNVGVSLVRPDEGRLWAEHARVLAHHAHDASGLLEAKRLVNLAAIESTHGGLEESLRHYDEAIVAMRAALGPDHPSVIDALGAQAVVHHHLGAHDEAREVLEELLALRKNSLGEDHPTVTAAMNNLASMYLSAERPAQARDLYRQALDINERNLGTDHPRLATSLTGLASSYNALGELESAQRLIERAIEILEGAHGPEYPGLASHLTNLGNIHRRSGRNEEARAFYERALRLTEGSLGPDHPSVAKILINLALAAPKDEAVVLAERALKLQVDAMGPDHPRTRRFRGLYELLEDRLAQ